jgi:NAD(P)-dependent dehydrogenase (short-subunit alcohol dehydrogenase family)
MFKLQGDRVLVLGGTSGIGLTTAQALRDLGAAVTIASRSQERVTAATRELNGVQGAVLDVTSDEAVEKFFAAGEPWQHIIVSIAPGKSGTVRGTSLPDAYASMSAKFWSAYRVARFAKFSGNGSLTFVSGQVGKRPNPNAVLLGAINAGLEGLARGLALELAPIRVNAVAPGLIDTPLHNMMPAEMRQGLFKATAERLPARRMGTATDVAQAIVYVTCNGFTTGSTVRVDGGSTIC